jgi:leucyl-tRNA synthetase
MVLKDGNVMSKSKGNVVDPDSMLQKFGADALRLYVMFVAPPEKEVEWTDAGLEGSFRFLARVWRPVDHCADTVGGDGIAGADSCENLTPAERSLRRKTHETIQRVTTDIEQRQQLNTAVSAMMELVNELYAFSEQTVTGGPARRTDEDVEAAGKVERRETICVVREAVEALILMLSPFAPHTAEELWEVLGGDGGLVAASWPAFNAEAARAEEVVIPVQINGKVRGRISASPDASEADLERIALGDSSVQSHLSGKSVKKVVVVKGRLVSIVAA